MQKIGVGGGERRRLLEEEEEEEEAAATLCVFVTFNQGQIDTNSLNF